MREASPRGFLPLVCVLALFLAPPLSSQEPLVLTLEKAAELALENSIDLQKQRIDLDNAAFAANSLWSELFPSLSASLALNYGNTPLFTDGGFQASGENLNYSAGMALSLPLGLSLSPTMRIARLAYQASLADYENARRDLGIGIGKAFYSLLAEREKLSLLEGTKALAERQLEKNRASFRNGQIGELASLQGQLSAETARLNFSRAEATYADNLGKFLVRLGLEQNTPAALEGGIAITRFDGDPEALIRERLPSRPDIVRLRREIERLELARQRTAGSSRVPSLSLGANWRGGSSTPGGGIGGSFSDTLSGSLTLNIPIDGWIPGTKTNQAIRTADGDIEKARLTLRNAESEAMTTIRSLATGLKNSWLSIEIAQFQVQLAERTYQLTEQGFQNGAVEFLVLEDNRNKMTEARQQLLDGRLAYKIMMLDLSSALNIDEGDLAGSVP